MTGCSIRGAVPDLIRDLLDVDHRKGPGSYPGRRLHFVNHASAVIAHGVLYLHRCMHIALNSVCRCDGRYARADGGAQNWRGKSAHAAVSHSRFGVFRGVPDTAFGNGARAQTQALATCVEERLDRETESKMARLDDGGLFSVRPRNKCGAV